MTEQKLLLAFCSGRINARMGNCPVQLCGKHTSRLDRHLASHKELTSRARKEAMLESKRHAIFQNLKALQASNPSVPLVSTLDLEEQRRCRAQEKSEEAKLRQNPSYKQRIQDLRAKISHRKLLIEKLSVSLRRLSKNYCQLQRRSAQLGCTKAIASPAFGAKTGADCAHLWAMQEERRKCSLAGHRDLILQSVLFLALVSFTSSYNYENESVKPEVSIRHGNILSPLLKALSEQDPWGGFRPKAKPDSRYVRYMKRLYKLSSKADRRPEATHLYNTARLITPREECLEQNREFFLQDISYSLTRMKSQEQLLKSVLLYSFDHNHIAPFTSLCYLDVQEQKSSKHQMCSHRLDTQHSVPLLSFRVHTERRVRRRWVEVDVTSFLHPLIQAHKKDIHLLINLTCVEDMIRKPGGQIHKSPVELTHRSPSLLLYLNDTSEVAYQRRPSRGRMVDLTSNHWDRKSALRKSTSRQRRGTLESTIPPDEGTETSMPRVVPMYDFPTDDCDLYDFRVSFNQLKLDHWIIAPQKYNPRYCKGSCPRALGCIYGSPVHTMVQNIIYEKLDSSVPRPSCVPSEYNPLSILTRENDGSFVYKEYEEMIATKCTCR
ncbi:hypothetical protein DNTS_025507 [Danionella cerebrum]|uniref:TGF-beta family profile domain-containing protein n=1 Tax=Danionella cerebrum TaxID=2873325 RepID=A0A553R9B1_9TELE|nr:hypothetical protein DNTS_025507 [Danionella translucida]